MQLFSNPMLWVAGLLTSTLGCGAAWLILDKWRRPERAPRKFDAKWNSWGLPHDSPEFTMRQTVALAVMVFAMSFTVIMGATQWWPRSLVLGLNACAIAIGGALRFWSHGRSENWRFLDHYGKAIAYYGAFASLMTLSVSG